MDFANYWFSSGSNTPPGPDPGLIGNSLRFRGSQRLTRNFSGSSSGSGQVWTLSMWLKDSVENQQRTPFTAGNGGEFYCGLSFFSGNSLGKWSYVKNNGQRPMYECGDRFRDPTAWFHLVVRSETTNSNGALRDRFYINGREYRNFPVWANVSSQNQGLPWMGSTTTHYIGSSYNGAQAWRGYMAEVHCCDGQSLGPEHFGEFNDDGVWVPIIPSGLNYGNWGFHLDFSDPANIGADRSGRGNNFTPTNFELTSTTSTSYDSSIGSPTRNIATLNPLTNYGTKEFLLKDANLLYDSHHGGQNNSPATSGGVNSGQYYYEFIAQQGHSVAWKWGLMDQNTNNLSLFEQMSAGIYFNSGTDVYRIQNGSMTHIGNFSGGGVGNNDVVGIGFNADTGVVTVHRNGSQVGSFNMSSVFGSRRMVPWTGFAAGSGGRTNWMNFGQLPWRNNPPAGYVGWSTADLPAPNLPATITGTFSGNGSSNGPFVYTGCVPGRIQYGSVNVTYGNRLSQSNVDFLANGFKVRSSTSNSGTVSYTVTTTHSDGDYNGHQVPYGGAGVSPAPACFN